MNDLNGKVAFITGGGSGIGLAQAKVLAKAGAKVVIADIRQDHLDTALRELEPAGAAVHPIVLDVTDRAAYAAAADQAEAVFGPVQLLFNTAGVCMFGTLERATYEDYDWQMDVNFGGVVNGLQTFVPRMVRRGGGGHIVNTASMAAFVAHPYTGIYTASKFAVRGLSEVLRQELAPHAIGVSVLCPTTVNTNIADGVNTRPAKYRNSGYDYDERMKQSLKHLYAAGRDPMDLANEVLHAVRENQLYVIPYAEVREPLMRHFSSVIAALPPENTDPRGVAQRRAAIARFRNEFLAMQRRSPNPAD